MSASSSKAKQKAEKSATELGTFDDDRSSLLTRYQASHPSNNTGRVGQTTCKYGNAADGLEVKNPTRLNSKTSDGKRLLSQREVCTSNGE